MSGYWFAKCDLVRGKMQPVSREGKLVGLGMAAMVAGGLLFALLAMNGYVALGIGTYVTVSIVAGIAFIVIAAKTCDPAKTVEDYRLGRVGRQTVS